MKVEIKPIENVRDGDQLKNGETIIDAYYNNSGNYSLVIERYDTNGEMSTHEISYPPGSFVRIVNF